jgi:glycosyltransferase involved in cell wall biosynthesis
MIAATPFFADRGCHIRIYNEIKYLHRLGYEIELLTYHVGRDVGGIRIDRISASAHYDNISPGASWHKIYLDFLLFCKTLLRFIKVRPEIIHAHLYEGLLVAWLAKTLSLSKAPIVFDCQGSLAEEMYSYHLRKYPAGKLVRSCFRLLERLLLKLPDLILCSSERSRDILSTRYRVDSKKLMLLPDGFDPELVVNAEFSDVTKLRQSLGIPDANLVVLYSGTLSRAKGVHNLLNLVPAAVAADSRLTFLFVGYGELLEEYRIKLSSHVTEGNVVFTGRVSYFDLPNYLTIASLAVDPKYSSTESSAKMPLYLSAGLPVVCLESPNEDLTPYVMRLNKMEDLLQFLRLGIFPQRAERTSGLSSYSWRVLASAISDAYQKLHSRSP